MTISRSATIIRHFYTADEQLRCCVCYLYNTLRVKKVWNLQFRWGDSCADLICIVCIIFIKSTFYLLNWLKVGVFFPYHPHTHQDHSLSLSLSLCSLLFLFSALFSFSCSFLLSLSYLFSLCLSHFLTFWKAPPPALYLAPAFTTPTPTPPYLPPPLLVCRWLPVVRGIIRVDSLSPPHSLLPFPRTLPPCTRARFQATPPAGTRTRAAQRYYYCTAPLRSLPRFWMVNHSRARCGAVATFRSRRTAPCGFGYYRFCRCLRSLPLAPRCALSLYAYSADFAHFIFAIDTGFAFTNTVTTFVATVTLYATAIKFSYALLLVCFERLLPFHSLPLFRRALSRLHAVVGACGALFFPLPPYSLSAVFPYDWALFPGTLPARYVCCCFSGSFWYLILWLPGHVLYTCAHPHCGRWTHCCAVHWGGAIYWHFFLLFSLVFSATWKPGAFYFPTTLLLLLCSIVHACVMSPFIIIILVPIIPSAFLPIPILF